MKALVSMAAASAAVLVLSTASPAQAATQYSWSQSAAGVTVSGVWWKDANGYIVIQGSVKDTAGDSKSAVAQIHFIEDCCSMRVEADGGVGTSRSFGPWRSGTKAPSSFRTKVGLERFGITTYSTDWKTYSTF